MACGTCGLPVATRVDRLAGAQTWAGLGIFAHNLQRMTALSG
jgi:transposase, IS5 family